MKKTKIAALALAATSALSAKPALAMCPICTVAVAGGLGILERYGVDDVLSGIWVGALIISMVIWTNDLLLKKGWTFKHYKPVVWVAYFALTLVPLYTAGYLFANKGYILGIDRLFFGIVVGAVTFAVGGLSYKAYKAKHGKALFPFQKVAQPVGLVAIVTAVFYFLTA